MTMPMDGTNTEKKVQTEILNIIPQNIGSAHKMARSDQNHVIEIKRYQCVRKGNPNIVIHLPFLHAKHLSPGLLKRNHR